MTTKRKTRIILKPGSDLRRNRLEHFVGCYDDIHCVMVRSRRVGEITILAFKLVYMFEKASPLIFAHDVVDVALFGEGLLRQ